MPFDAVRDAIDSPTISSSALLSNASAADAANLFSDRRAGEDDEETHRRQWGQDQNDYDPEGDREQEVYERQRYEREFYERRRYKQQQPLLKQAGPAPGYSDDGEYEYRGTGREREMMVIETRLNREEQYSQQREYEYRRQIEEYPHRHPSHSEQHPSPQHPQSDRHYPQQQQHVSPTFERERLLQQQAPHPHSDSYLQSQQFPTHDSQSRRGSLATLVNSHYPSPHSARHMSLDLTSFSSLPYDGEGRRELELAAVRQGPVAPRSRPRTEPSVAFQDRPGPGPEGGDSDEEIEMEDATLDPNTGNSNPAHHGSPQSSLAQTAQLMPHVPSKSRPISEASGSPRRPTSGGSHGASSGMVGLQYQSHLQPQSQQYRPSTTRSSPQPPPLPLPMPSSSSITAAGPSTGSSRNLSPEHHRTDYFAAQDKPSTYQARRDTAAAQAFFGSPDKGTDIELPSSLGGGYNVSPSSKQPPSPSTGRRESHPVLSRGVDELMNQPIARSAVNIAGGGKERGNIPSSVKSDSTARSGPVSPQQPLRRPSIGVEISSPTSVSRPPGSQPPPPPPPISRTSLPQQHQQESYPPLPPPKPPQPFQHSPPPTPPSVLPSHPAHLPPSEASRHLRDQRLSAGPYHHLQSSPTTQPSGPSTSSPPSEYNFPMGASPPASVQPYNPNRITRPSRALLTPLDTREAEELFGLHKSMNTLRTRPAGARDDGGGGGGLGQDTPGRWATNGRGEHEVHGALRKRRRESDAAGPPPRRRRLLGNGSVGDVANHYNSRLNTSRTERLNSPIFHLKCFNNWTKSVLIDKFHLASGTSTAKQPKLKVLDLGCGKGGDLLKWAKAGAEELVGVDVAAVSIEQAEQRWREMTGHKFKASFFAVDCFSNDLSSVIPEEILSPKPPRLFDIASMQFCMHYAFDTEQRARTMLSNVSKWLVKGGRFIGTIPNPETLLDKMNKAVQEQPDSSGPVVFGNSCYEIEFESTQILTYGQKYTFFLQDAVEDVPEYVVHWGNFEKLAAEYNLRVLYTKPFGQLFLEQRIDPEHFRLAKQMKVLPNDASSIESPSEAMLSSDEWEVADLYLAFAFIKY